MTDDKEKAGEEKPVVENSVEELPKKLVIDNLYCPTCKERKLDKDLDKQPLGYNKAEDGSVVADLTRFTVFCKKCQTMLIVVAPDTVKELENIKRARS